MTATSGGILASIFAVSRMLAMLTEMKLVLTVILVCRAASRSTRWSTLWSWGWL